MLKFVSVVVLGVASLLANARSVYNGPVLLKTVGPNACSITPGWVVKRINGKVTNRSVSLSHTELTRAITEASQQKMVLVAARVRKTEPAVKVVAKLRAVEPKEVLLYLDSSDVRKRSGQSAEDLLEQVRALCGDF